MARPVKWGHLHQIDYRCKVGSDAWKARHSTKMQHLTAFRYLHDISPHEDVRHLADAPISKKLKEIKKRGG